MSIVSGFMNQEVNIYSVSKDSYGDITRTLVYESTPCRFVERVGRLVSSEAITKDYIAECWIDSGYTIEETYEVVYETRTYKIVGINKRNNLFGGEDHTKLFLA